MSRIQDYLLTTDLAKSLAFWKAKKPAKARAWADKLVVAMAKARLLSDAGHGAGYVNEVKRALAEDNRR